MYNHFYSNTCRKILPKNILVDDDKLQRLPSRNIVQRFKPIILPPSQPLPLFKFDSLNPSIVNNSNDIDNNLKVSDQANATEKQESVADSSKLPETNTDENTTNNSEENVENSTRVTEEGTQAKENQPICKIGEVISNFDEGIYNNESKPKIKVIDDKLLFNKETSSDSTSVPIVSQQCASNATNIPPVDAQGNPLPNYRKHTFIPVHIISNGDIKILPVLVGDKKQYLLLNQMPKENQDSSTTTIATATTTATSPENSAVKYPVIFPKSPG